MPTDLLTELNDEQRKAVLYNNGPELVIAGAGSGKTRVITHKIAYLIQQGMNPYNILALTFTNKAAREMIERTTKLLNNYPMHNMWIGTFHSIAAKILRIEIKNTKYQPGFTIYDTTDSKNIIRQICKEHKFDDKLYSPALVLHKISTAKNHLILPYQYANNTTLAKQDSRDQLYEMPKFYSIYQNTLLNNNAMDFDDILLNLHTLLNENQYASQKYSQLFHYILVDEYQDTNFIQNILIQILSRTHNKLCVVGDDAQSIYAFRGADIHNILNFMSVHKNAQLFKLQQNYRSTQYIVNIANDLIKHNPRQIQKQVFSQNAEGEKIQLAAFSSDKEEGDGIAQMILRILKQTNAACSNEVAVLYRTNAQSRIFENALRQHNIPYNIFGTTGFFQRKEIKDILAYLRIFVNPLDEEAMLRVINFPKRGIGNTTIQSLKQTADQNNTDLYTLITNLSNFNHALPKTSQSKISSFANKLQKTKEKLTSLDAYSFTKFVIDNFDIMEEYQKEETNLDKNEKSENIEELLHAIFDFANDPTNNNTNIANFLQNVSLLTDQDTNKQENNANVALMTIHNAKGLEFKNVFIVGLEENLFPSAFCTSDEEIEEERRLLYVAITRAMKTCNLSYACQRFKNGSILPSVPSRFVKELNKNYLTTKNTLSSNYIPSTSYYKPSGTPYDQKSSIQPIQCQFKPNDTVYHSVFGQGVVIETFRENENDKIKINFGKNGTRTLLLQYAKLQKSISTQN